MKSVLLYLVETRFCHFFIKVRKALDVDDDRAAASSLRAHRDQEIQFNIKPQISTYVCTADTASSSLLKVRSSVVSNYPEKITRKQKYHTLTHSHTKKRKKKETNAKTSESGDEPWY